jgi:hypothetical protein
MRWSAIRGSFEQAVDHFSEVSDAAVSRESGGRRI